MNGSPADQLVGAVLNAKWRLVRLLGEGGMGAVYEADGTHGEGKRAIKLLHQEYVKEEQVLTRFFAEAQANRSLRHPNVAQVFDAQTAENGTPYLEMELLVGVPLATYTDQGTAIPPQQAVPIVYGVLQALTMAHTQRIVHRDLKPDNLFLVRDQTGNFQVKVLDFGIAKVMDVAGGMGQKTRTGVLLGTPGYMSPEQIKNSKAVDARSDLWSVGIIFYELLTAKTPFPADNEFTRLTCVLTEEVKPIEVVAPHLAAWAPFMRKALAKEPSQRFQTAEEMAQALMTVARGGQLGAGQSNAAALAATAPGGPGGSPLQAAVAQVNAQVAQAQQPQQAQQAQGAGFQEWRPQQPAASAYAQTPAPPTAGQGQGHPMTQQSATPQYGQPAPKPSSHPGPPKGSSVPPPPAGGGGASPTHVSGTGPAPQGASATHMSPIQPQGRASYVPQIEVIQSPGGSKGAPYWLVAVIGVVMFGIGLAVGLLVA